MEPGKRLPRTPTPERQSEPDTRRVPPLLEYLKVQSKSATSEKALARLERMRTVIKMRRAGSSYDDIGKALGLKASRAFEICMKALNITCNRFAADCAPLRELEGQRLDALLAAAWGAAMDGDLDAIATCARLVQQRTDMYGLSAPVRAEITGADGGPVQVLDWVDLAEIAMKERARRRGEAPPALPAMASPFMGDDEFGGGVVVDAELTGADRPRTMTDEQEVSDEPR